ncbi:MAG: dTDP-4-dehydrorhamnose 3,5-epimerase family protein [Bacteroidetes bacterium]|nr:dTDP-4-dehydrorhamnose 3,5-epimerase family protein [Bacteroidota bacterium]
MKGVVVTLLKKIPGELGDVRHGLKQSDSDFQSFGEAYFSTVKKGYVKGWKKHQRMVLNLIVAEGKIRFIIYDDRQGSETQGQYFQITLSPAENYSRLTIQPGLWLAFEGVGDGNNLLLNIASIEHDPTEAESSSVTDGKIKLPI